MNQAMTHALEGLSSEQRHTIRKELSKAKKKVRGALLEHQPLPCESTYKRAIKSFEESMLAIYARMVCLRPAELDASMDSIHSEVIQIARTFYTEMGLYCEALQTS
jgi:hypothetical protein